MDWPGLQRRHTWCFQFPIGSDWREFTRRRGTRFNDTSCTDNAMRTLYITSQDNARLRLLLLLTPHNSTQRRELEFLRGELDRAFIVPNGAALPSAVHLGSTFNFTDLDTGENGTCTLCLPSEQSRFERALSVTSHFGAAVIGCSVGDTVQWHTAVGRRRIVIRSVRQPRSATPPGSAGAAWKGPARTSPRARRGGPARKPQRSTSNNDPVDA